MDEAVLVPQCKVSLTNILLQNEKMRRRSCFSGILGGWRGFLLYILKFILSSPPSYSQERKKQISVLHITLLLHLLTLLLSTVTGKEVVVMWRSVSSPR